MGNKSSKRKAKYNHIDCVCKLYSKTKHCCNFECFIHPKYQQKQLLKSLQIYNAQHIVNIIMDYLSHNELTQATADEKYAAYFHCTTLQMYNNGLPPCITYYNEFNSEIKVGLFGPNGVGRSSLCIRYVANNFVEDYDPSCPDTYRKQTNINGVTVLMDIMDWCGGDEDFVSMNEMYMKDNHFFGLCFAKNNASSFRDALKNKDKIIKLKQKENDDQFGMIFVVTKCDLNDANDANYVDLALAKQVAMECNIPYIETSSKNGNNVKLLFEQVVYELWIQSQTKCIS